MLAFIPFFEEKERLTIMRKRRNKLILLFICFALVMTAGFMPEKTYAASPSYKVITDQPQKIGKYYYKYRSHNSDLLRSKKKNSGYKCVIKQSKKNSNTIPMVTNGKYVFAIIISYKDSRQTIVRYKSNGKKPKNIKKLPKGSNKYESYDWSIPAITGQNIMLTRSRSGQSDTFKYNRKSKKLKKVLKNCGLIARSGKYVVGSNGTSQGTDPRRCTLYTLNKAGNLKKVKVIGEKIVSGPAFAGKKLYYTIDSANRADLYRCERNGSGIEKLGTFWSNDEYQQIMISKFTSTNCEVTIYPDVYRYTYATRSMQKIRSFY